MVGRELQQSSCLHGRFFIIKGILWTNFAEGSGCRHVQQILVDACLDRCRSDRLRLIQREETSCKFLRSRRSTRARSAYLTQVKAAPYGDDHRKIAMCYAYSTWIPFEMDSMYDTTRHISRVPLPESRQPAQRTTWFKSWRSGGRSHVSFGEFAMTWTT